MKRHYRRTAIALSARAAPLMLMGLLITACGSGDAKLDGTLEIAQISSQLELIVHLADEHTPLGLPPSVASIPSVVSVEVRGPGGVHPILLTRRVSARTSWGGVIDESQLKRISGGGCVLRIASRTIQLAPDHQRSGTACTTDQGTNRPAEDADETDVILFRIRSEGEHFPSCRCAPESAETPAVSITLSAPSVAPLNACLEGTGTLELSGPDSARFRTESITIGSRPATSLEPNFQRFTFRIPPVAFGAHSPDVDVQMPVRVELHQQGSTIPVFLDAGTLDFRTGSALDTPIACD